MKIKIWLYITFTEVALLFNLPGLTQMYSGTSSANSRVLEEISVKKRMNWGFRQGSPPISFQDKYQNQQGFCTELIDLLFKYLKDHQFLKSSVEIAPYPISIQDRFNYTRYPYKDKDELHLAGECGPDSIQKQEGITFSNPFYTTKTVFLIRNSKKEKLSILKNSVPFRSSDNSKPIIGAISSSVTPGKIQYFFDSILSYIEIKKINNRSEAMKALSESRIDAFASDEIILREMLKDLNSTSSNKNQFSIDSSFPEISHESYGLILPSDDKQWVNIINNFLSEQKEDIDKLIKEKITPTPQSSPVTQPSSIEQEQHFLFIFILFIFIVVAFFSLVLMYLVRRSPSPSPSEPTPPYRLTDPPMVKMKKILILLANPKDTSQLSLGQEARKIQEAIRLATHRDQFEIVSEWAVRRTDVRRALLNHQPHIVHFCGHGTGSEGLVLQDDVGNSQLMSNQSLAELFELFRGTVECVLLNACYSEVQADLIHHHVDYVIGMRQPIEDDAAIQFATGFYDALGAGTNYDYAFSMGKASFNSTGVTRYPDPILKSRPSASL